MTLYLLLLGLVGLGRLAELVVSRRNRDRMVQEHQATPGEDPIFPLMVFLHVMPFWAIPLELWIFQRTFAPWPGWWMVGIFAGATVLRFWTLASLRGYWNAQVMVPPDLKPVTRGPYAHIRHPNYVVVILELFSLPLIYSCYYSSLALTALNALVLYYRIGAEERQLFASEAYRRAMSDKPRFIPRLWR